MSKNEGQLFQIQVAVPGRTAEEAWEELMHDPSAYLPRTMGSSLGVMLHEGNARFRQVISFGDPKHSPTEEDLDYAKSWGWAFEEVPGKSGYFYKKGQKDATRVIVWSDGWSPWRHGTGVCDNASFGSPRAAIICADKMFYEIDHLEHLR